MIFAILALAILMVGASVITAHAALTAREGYEDEQGFHPMAAAPAGGRPARSERIPPFAAAR